MANQQGEKQPQQGEQRNNPDETVAKPRQPGTDEQQGSRERTGIERSEDENSEQPERTPNPERAREENNAEQRAQSNTDKAELGEQAEPRKSANQSKTEH